MSFQDEYKITNADRLDKGVYGLPDTPGMTTAAIQERFDSLGNLAIDKFNALVEAASDVVDGSDTKFPTNKAVEDYISGEGGAIIDDTTPSLHKAYSSQKVENMFGDVASRVIDDTEPSSDKTYSSAEIEDKLSNIPSPESIIDDDTASTDTTYSSSKLESDFISVSDTEEQTATDEFSTINGGLLSSLKVSLSPNQDLHGYPNPWVGGAGKNLFYCRANSGTLEGITLTVNKDDGGNVVGITVNGTASADCSYRIGEITLQAGTYVITGCPSNGSSSVNLRIGKNPNSTYVGNEEGGGFTLTVNESAEYTININISRNVTVNNIVFKPMIRLASESDPTFEPYSNICPISGHTQSKVKDDGKNLCDPTVIPLNGLGGDHYVATTLPVGSVVARIKGGETYTVSIKNAQTIFTSTCKEYPTVDAPMIDNYAGSGGLSVTSKTITTSVGANYLVVNTGSNNYEEIQIEEGSTATPYVPYNGYQITVNLGGTYYSGTLDVVSGVLVATWVSERMLNTYGWSLNTTPITDRRFQWNYGSGTVIPKGINQNGTFICSHLKPSNLGVNNTPFGYFYISQSWVVIPDRDSFFATIDEFKNWLSDNEVYICYKLATPQTIQLTPQQVKALVGENHLDAPLDGQEITESVYSPLAKWNAVIDDTTASDDTTYSSNEIEEKLSNVPITPINDTSASLTSVYSSSKVVDLINSIPGCQIDDENETSYTTYSSEKIVELINGTIRPITGSITSNLTTTIGLE